MYPLKFNRRRAAALLATIEAGEPIQPTTAGGWSPNDLVLLAGVCAAVVHDAGPANYRAKFHGDVDCVARAIARLPREHREAISEQLAADVAAAVEFSGELVRLSRSQIYHEYFDETVSAAISKPVTRRRKIVALGGWKNEPAQPQMS